MARRSQTELAILGALSMRPMTAYAVRAAIRDVLGHFWSESFGQIYPTLAALDRQGMVEGEESGRRGSSVFSLTDAGRQRLVELLAEPVVVTPPRNGLLLRLFFGRALGVAACRDLLLQARADAERRRREYESLADEVRVEDAGSADLPYLLITIAAGRHDAEASLRWAAEALELLDRASAGRDPEASR